MISSGIKYTYPGMEPMWIFLNMKGSNHLVLVRYVGYRLGSRGI
jgi:hypothetical protein